MTLAARNTVKHISEGFAKAKTLKLSACLHAGAKHFRGVSGGQHVQEKFEVIGVIALRLYPALSGGMERKFYNILQLFTLVYCKKLTNDNSLQVN